MAQPLPPQPLLPEAGHCCAAVIGDIDDDYRVGGLDRGVVFASPPVWGAFSFPDQRLRGRRDQPCDPPRNVTERRGDPSGTLGTDESFSESWLRRDREPPAVANSAL